MQVASSTFTLEGDAPISSFLTSSFGRKEAQWKHHDSIFQCQCQECSNVATELSKKIDQKLTFNENLWWSICAQSGFPITSSHPPSAQQQRPRPGSPIIGPAQTPLGSDSTERVLPWRCHGVVVKKEHQVKDKGHENKVKPRENHVIILRKVWNLGKHSWILEFLECEFWESGCRATTVYNSNLTLTTFEYLMATESHGSHNSKRSIRFYFLSPQKVGQKIIDKKETSLADLCFDCISGVYNINALDSLKTTNFVVFFLSQGRWIASSLAFSYAGRVAGTSPVVQSLVMLWFHQGPFFSFHGENKRRVFMAGFDIILLISTHESSFYIAFW